MSVDLGDWPLIPESKHKSLRRAARQIISIEAATAAATIDLASADTEFSTPVNHVHMAATSDAATSSGTALTTAANSAGAAAMIANEPIKTDHHTPATLLQTPSSHLYTKRRIPSPNSQLLHDPSSHGWVQWYPSLECHGIIINGRSLLVFV